MGKLTNLAESKFTIALYTLAIIAAEVITTYQDVKFGLVFYSLILILFVAHVSSLLANREKMKIKIGNLPFLLLFLSVLSLMRLLSYATPFVAVPTIYWYLIISVPIYAAIVLAFRNQKILLEKVANFKPGLMQIAIALTGLAFGVVEFFILKPAPLIPSINIFDFAVAAGILLIATGLVEELLFRGAIQYNAVNTLGVKPGILFTAFIFAVMHIGWKSIPDLVFVFCIGLLYGAIFHKTRNLLGLTFSHGLTNIILFLVMPFYFL